MPTIKVSPESMRDLIRVARELGVTVKDVADSAINIAYGEVEVEVEVEEEVEEEEEEEEE